MLSMGEVILRMKGIHKYFSGAHAVNDTQLELKAGEVMALVGEDDETLDIFAPGMENVFAVGKKVIDSILKGEF